MTQDQWGFIDFELSEQNVRIFDPCYAATAILSESFADSNKDELSKWLGIYHLGIYHNIIAGYDDVVTLSEVEKLAIPYVILSNQFIAVAWFSEQEKYQDLFEVNKKMTEWLMEHLEELNV